MSAKEQNGLAARHGYDTPTIAIIIEPGKQRAILIDLRQAVSHRAS